MIYSGLYTHTCPQYAPVRIVIPPHAGGSTSYFRNWDLVADNLGMELCATQYPGHEELFTATRASSLDELAEALVTMIGNQTEWTVPFSHLTGGLLAHRATQSLVAEDNPPQVLYVSATRALDQPVMTPHHILGGRAFVSSIGEASPGKENPLEDEDLIAVLLDQVRGEMRLAETYRCKPTPLPLPITLHLTTEDPNFMLADVSTQDRFTTRGAYLIIHPGHRLYLSIQQATALRVAMENLSTTSPFGK